VPTYAYACTTCGHRFDIYQAFTDDALMECPECGGPLRKEFGNVGVVFKGSGFYRNDARKSASNAASSSTGSSGSASSGSGSSGSGSTSSESSAGKDTGSSSSTSGSTGTSTSKPASSPTSSKAAS
jgi:putative FmdB family regulatory protein